MRYSKKNDALVPRPTEIMRLDVSGDRATCRDRSGQCLRRKSREIDASISTDFLMHCKIGGNHRQSAGHRLHQWVRECFSVGRSYVNISPAIQADEADGTGSRPVQQPCQTRQAFSPGRRPFQVDTHPDSSRLAACRSTSNLTVTVAQSVTQKRQRSNQGLEIPVIVVVTDKE